MLTWTITVHDGHYHSTDGRFDLYPERRPENDNNLTWTLIDRQAENGVENGYDTHVQAHAQAERLSTDNVQDALDESVARLRKSGRNRHDDGLILALAANGWRWWRIASVMSIADGYVQVVVRRGEKILR